MQEIWKDVAGYEGKYQVSNLGRVKSLLYINGKTMIKRILVLTPFNKKGRLYVKLCNIQNKHFTLSRLVAQAFLGLNLSSRWTLVCHKDDNPLNNRLDNLFIGSPKENTRDMISKGRCNSGKYKQKLTYQYDLNNFLLNTFQSTAEASRMTGVRQSTISRCCNGKLKIAGGFIWSY